MSLDACADLVRNGDPDRFMAVMAAPVAARRILLPIYACNVEVARAPWASQEPMIAEMRLQWWWDALEEIVTGVNVRAHEVTTPLVDVLDAEGARILQANVDARRRDAQRHDPTDIDEVMQFLAQTGGSLMWAAARAMGSISEKRSRSVGQKLGLANYLLAVPELRAMGRQPWPEMTGRAFIDLVKQTRDSGTRLPRDRAMRVAELAAWRANGVLSRAIANPKAVGEGMLVESELRKRWSLIWSSMGIR